MKFNQHSDLKDKHSFFSASKPYWLNYTPEKVLDRYSTVRAAVRGTELHAFAHEAIRLGMKLPNTAQTVNMYVNDCIGFRMQNEQTLVYSSYAFGTADAIAFRKGPDDVMVLRIFDLKTGVTPANATQLLVYAAYFCLEYRVRPMEIDYDLRIYQSDEILDIEVESEEIAHIMDRIVEFEKLIKTANELEEV